MMRVAVYKHWGWLASDVETGIFNNLILLYTGQAINLKYRHRVHSKRSRWWPMVQYISWVWCETQEDAIILEGDSIIDERPLFNRRGPEQLKDPEHRILPYWWKEYYGLE